MKGALYYAEIVNELADAFAEEYRSRLYDGEEDISSQDVISTAIETVSANKEPEDVKVTANEFFDEETIEDLIEDVRGTSDPYRNPLRDLGLSEKDFL